MFSNPPAYSRNPVYSGLKSMGTTTYAYVRLFTLEVFVERIPFGAADIKAVTDIKAYSLAVRSELVCFFFNVLIVILHHVNIGAHA